MGWGFLCRAFCCRIFVLARASWPLQDLLGVRRVDYDYEHEHGTGESYEAGVANLLSRPAAA